MERNQPQRTYHSTYWRYRLLCYRSSHGSIRCFRTFGTGTRQWWCVIEWTYSCRCSDLTIQQSAGESGLPQYYTYSATNVRLQEASLGYTIPRKWLGNACDIQVSVVGRNLWMIYNKAPFDPEAVATTDNYYQGIDYFMLPSTRNIGVNVKITF